MGILDGIPLTWSARAAEPKSSESLSAPLLCLFFSAEWCPQCVSFVPSFVNAYRSASFTGRADVAFVSSDKSEELMTRYMAEALHSSWPAVAFEGDYRADLKRRYGVCASVEVRELGMTAADRKSGIPTIAVFRASDGVLLTMDGVKDIQDMGPAAIDRWEVASSGTDTS